MNRSVHSSLGKGLLGIIGLILSLIVLAPLLLQSYGDVILTKMLFQTWCRDRIF